MRASQLSQPHCSQLPTCLLFVGLGLFCGVFLLQDRTITSVTGHQIICHKFGNTEATTASCPKLHIRDLRWTPRDGAELQTIRFLPSACASHEHECGRMGPRHAPGLHSRADEQREGKMGNNRDVISQNKRTKPLRLSENKTAVPIDFSHTMFLQQKHSSANRGPV